LGHSQHHITVTPVADNQVSNVMNFFFILTKEAGIICKCSSLESRGPLGWALAYFASSSLAKKKSFVTNSRSKGAKRRRKV
jgi:hypothetical protein